MEISGLVNPETLFDLDVEHPATGEPMGIKIMVRSAGSDAAKDIVRKHTDGILAKQQKGVLVNAETIEKNEIDQAVSYVASWDWGSNTYDGKKPDSSPETIKAILTKEGWLYAAVTKAARSIANFTKG